MIRVARRHLSSTWSCKERVQFMVPTELVFVLLLTFSSLGVPGISDTLVATNGLRSTYLKVLMSSVSACCRDRSAWKDRAWFIARGGTSCSESRRQTRRRMMLRRLGQESRTAGTGHPGRSLSALLANSESESNRRLTRRHCLQKDSS